MENNAKRFIKKREGLSVFKVPIDELIDESAEHRSQKGRLNSYTEDENGMIGMDDDQDF